MANPEHIQTCLEDAKSVLIRVIKDLPAGPTECLLKNCLGNLDKIEALMKGDYETVWQIEADQRKRDSELHKYAMSNLVKRQQTLKELCEPSPVVAALLARCSKPAQTRPVCAPTLLPCGVPEPQPAKPYDSSDEDLYS